MRKKSSKITCIMCDQSEALYWFNKQTDDLNYPIYKCGNCKSAFVWPRPDKEEIKLFYENTAKDSSLSKEDILEDKNYYPNAFADSKRIITKCKSLTSGNLFLDIGAGNGEFSRAALESGYQVQACDPSPAGREIFSIVVGFDPDPYMFEWEYARKYKNHFDVILMSHVLEHVLDPENVAHLSNFVLKKNGIAVIAIPHFGSALSQIQGKKDMFISPPEHLNFISIKGVISLFENKDFKFEQLGTFSKVNRGKVVEKVKVPILRDVIWMKMYYILKFFELFKKGMVINAYFRKLK